MFLYNCFIVIFSISMLLFYTQIGADISEFGLHELEEYNDMIKCLSTFKEDFIQCNRNVRQLADKVYDLFAENSTLGKAVKCCGIWMLRDCWYKRAEEQQCAKNQLHLIRKMPHKLLPMLHIWCDDYKEDSFICRVPHFWPLFLIIFIVIIIIIIISCVLCCVRRRRRCQSKDIETQSSINDYKADENNAIVVNNNDFNEIS